MLLEKVGEVRRGGVMEARVGEEFELDVLLNREPVELLEDMEVSCFGAGVREEEGSRVLDVL